MDSDFLAFLTDDQGRSLTENEKGIIVTSAVPNPLPNSPEGWQKNSVQWSRSKEFQALIRAYTTPLIFHFDGAKILRNYYYKVGREILLFFIWLKLDTNFGGNFQYRSWFKGSPDWYSFEDDDNGVQVGIIEAGLSKQINLDKATTYEIPFDDDTVSVILDGMNIIQSTNYFISNGFLPTNNGQHTLDATILSSESIAEIGATSQTRTKFKNNTELGKTNPLTITNPEVPVTMNISWHIGVNVTLAPGITPNPAAAGLLLIRCLDAQTDLGVAAFPLQAYGSDSTLYQHHFLEGNTTITVPANCKVYLCNFLTLGGVIATGSSADGVVLWQYDNNEGDFFKASYTYKFKKTVIDAHLSFNLGNKLIQTIGQNQSVLKSDLLQNDNNLLITSGDAIRGINTSVIKTSFSDFHKSIDAVKCVCFGIEDNNGRLEKREYAYQNTSNGNLGSSSNLKNTPALDYIYSDIINGYPFTDIGEVNGKYSFCNTVTYRTPASYKNTYDIKSVYLADPYVIEIKRINLEGKTTTDDDTDNQVFFLDCERVALNYSGSYVLRDDGTILLTGTALDILPGMRLKMSGIDTSYRIQAVTKDANNTTLKIADVLVPQTRTGIEFVVYKLRRKPYASVTGVPDPSTIFNLELSPKTNLKNHYNWLRSSLDKLDNKKIIFLTTDQNDKLARDGIIEREDILVGSMGAKIFVPEYLEFNAVSDVNLLDSSRLGYFEFDTFKGFPIDLKTEPATMETQTYKLLSHPSNDFTVLIDR